MPTRSAAILYGAFFGYYPIVMLFTERLKKPAVRWAVKLALFNAVMVILYFAVRAVFQGNWGVLSGYPLIMLLLANGLFILYDLALRQGVLYFMSNIAIMIATTIPAYPNSI